MATIKDINIGVSANDGTGDELREGFKKVNDNFAELDSKKVEKETGKGLSEEDFTTADKNKLSMLEGSHFKGVHANITDLEVAHPATNAEAGSYAYIKDGANAEKLAMLDGGVWLELSTGGTVPLTATQIKSLYESNKDTEGFTTAMKAVLSFITATKDINLDTTQDNVQVAFNRIASLGFAAPTPPEKSTKSQRDIELPKQTLDPDPVATAKDNRAITVANAFAIELALKQWVEQQEYSKGTGGLFQFDYKIKLDAASTTPKVKHISFDNTDVTKITKVYINKKDRLNADMGLFLEGIKKGDYFNIHDNNNIEQYVAFDVISDSVLNGDVYEINVKYYSNAGTLTNDERVYIHWKQEGEMSNLINNIGDIHSFVAGKDLATKLMELKVQVDKNTHTTGTASAPIISAGTIGAYSEGKFEYIDIQGFTQNPANPGKDIGDGTSHYVTFEVPTGKTLNTNTTWCWTKEHVPARMFTNAAKTQAVSPMELHAWINSNALVKIKLTGADWFVEDVHVPAVIPTVSSKALVTKGVITDIHDITEMGIYSGNNVANAPVTGHVIIEAFEDAQGDLDLTLKDQTSRRYEGGMPKGGTASWHNVAADHLFGSADPANTLGHDGDLYFKI